MKKINIGDLVLSFKKPIRKKRNKKSKNSIEDIFKDFQKKVMRKIKGGIV